MASAYRVSCESYSNSNEPKLTPPVSSMAGNSFHAMFTAFAFALFPTDIYLVTFILCVKHEQGELVIFLWTPE